MSQESERNMVPTLKKLLKRPSPGTALGLIALVVAASGAAYAAIPSADGVIHGCYIAGASPVGQLRVIDSEAGAKCAKNEKSLNWNAKGPKGDTGAQGPAGISGYEVVSEHRSFTEDEPNQTRGLGLSVQCPAGKKAVGGGADGNVLVGDVVTDSVNLTDSAPVNDPELGSFWLAGVGKPDGSYLEVGETLSATAYAICVSVDS